MNTIPGAQTFFGEDIGTIVNAVTPIVASMLQGRAYPQPGFSPLSQGLYGAPGWRGAQGCHGANLQPYEIAQIVSAVTPLVVSLIQSRGYQGHFGQFLPRAA